MSVHVNIPPYKTIVDHVSSSNGWEIDKYSDGTWQGSWHAKVSVPVTTAYGGMYRSEGIVRAVTPSGCTITRIPGGFVHSGESSGAPVVMMATTYSSTIFIVSPSSISASKLYAVIEMAEGTWS
jgi:hypothetical protein